MDHCCHQLAVVISVLTYVGVSLVYFQIVNKRKPVDFPSILVNRNKNLLQIHATQ